MIELRYLEKEVPYQELRRTQELMGQDEFVWVTKKEKVLQYRYLNFGIGVLNNLASKGWSDWIDVPTVNEVEDESK